jgi:nascent polypeptide-associated complex subunit alpha
MFDINPKLMKQAMKKMGVKQEEIDASRVIIEGHDKKIIINNPSVVKINMMGKDSFQISGDVSEEELEKFNLEDVKTVVSQAGCSEEDAKIALENNDGDIAAAIISFKET